MATLTPEATAMRHYRTLAGCLLLAVCFLAGTPRVDAALLVTNLGNAANGQISPQSTFWIAQKFTTDATEWDVTGLQFHGARHPNHTLTVSLYSHDGGADLPDASLGTFDASGVGTATGAQSLAPAGPMTLQANTSYWIVIAPSDVNTALWTQTLDLSDSGPAAIDPRRASSGNAGASWAALAAGNNQLFRLDATPVPISAVEVPAAGSWGLAILVVALALLAARALRRRHPAPPIAR